MRIDLKNAPENLPPYLRQLLPKMGIRATVINMEEVSKHTQVNYVYKVSLAGPEGNRDIYIKQAFSKLKKTGMEFPTNRIRYEAAALQKFRLLMGEGVVPQVIHFDEENHVLIMSDVKGGGKLLIDEFENGNIHPEAATRFGALIGDLHGKSYGTNDTIRNTEDETWVREFIYQFKTKGAALFAEREVKQLITESESVVKCFLGVDFADKNIFVDGREVRFCDFEAVFKGDPAFDVGHILAHYLLQVENNSSLTPDVSSFIHEFMTSYRGRMEALRVPPEYLKDSDRRAARYVAVFMLHRSHGRSPYKFFRPGVEERVKRDSLQIISSEPRTPEDTLRVIA